VPSDLVHLEITESVLMDNIDHSIPTLLALRGLGLHISVDDFGTGYSSLSYLKQLPVNTLKIDQSFVSGLGRDLQDRSIAQAIVALGNALDLEVLAEGIETPTQAATLVELGCRLGQGYLWSRPVPPDQAIALTGRRLEVATVEVATVEVATVEVATVGSPR
jgi:EAL domain-containing protein (putative c-di-GMP-specific phosphodiesterase class I)